MPKQIKSAKELNDLIAERFFEVPEVADDVRDDPRSDPKPPTVYWHEPDGVANWSARGGTNIRAYLDAISVIVIALRKAYDIDRNSEGA